MTEVGIGRLYMAGTGPDAQGMPGQGCPGPAMAVVQVVQSVQPVSGGVADTAVSDLGKPVHGSRFRGNDGGGCGNDGGMRE